MSDRDLDITKFSFFAYRKLKKTLGEFDAIVECNEIAIREFIEQSNKENSQDYIQRLSDKHNIKVDEVNFSKFNSRIRQYYVSSVSQQSEQFLKDFKLEWMSYFPNTEWSEPLNGQTKFQNTISNLSINIQSDLITVYEYYRLVRNYMSHTDRDLNKLNRLYKQIKNNSNQFLSDFHLTIFPNQIENINFDDFLILTTGFFSEGSQKFRAFKTIYTFKTGHTNYVQSPGHILRRTILKLESKF